MLAELGVLMGLLREGPGPVSDSFASFWDPFSPTGLPHPDMILGYMSSLLVTFYAMHG